MNIKEYECSLRRNSAQIRLDADLKDLEAAIVSSSIGDSLTVQNSEERLRKTFESYICAVKEDLRMYVHHNPDFSRPVAEA